MLLEKMPKIKEIKEIKSKIKEIRKVDEEKSESEEKADEKEKISDEVFDILDVGSGSNEMETLTLEPVSVRRENRAEAVEIPNQRREGEVDGESMAGRVYARNTLRGEGEEEGRLYGLRGSSQEEITRTYHLTTSAEPVTATLEESEGDDLTSNLRRQQRLGPTELDQVRRGDRIAREESQRYELQKKAKEESKPRRIHPWER